MADVPPDRKPERGYIRRCVPEQKPERGCVPMFPRNENRNEGTFEKNKKKHPNACFFPGFSSALTEVLGWDIRANDPRMSPGYPSQKLRLWADFSFLNNVSQKVKRIKRLSDKKWPIQKQLKSVRLKASSLGHGSHGPSDKEGGREDHPLHLGRKSHA